MLLPCYYHHVLHHHFDLFLITKSLLSRGKRASRVGGSRSRWQAGRTSINLHQLKVEEDRHALYQISANYMPSSSRSLQTTTTVVLTIINNISSLQLPQPVLRQLRALLPQLDCYRNPVRPTRGTEVCTASSNKPGHRYGERDRHCPHIPLQPMGGCQHLHVYVAIIRSCCSIGYRDV